MSDDRGNGFGYYQREGANGEDFGALSVRHKLSEAISMVSLIVVFIYSLWLGRYAVSYLENAVMAGKCFEKQENTRLDWRGAL